VTLRTAAVLSALLTTIGGVRIVSTYRVFNHTIDEPDQLAAGMEYLTTGRYLYEDEHPPLARVFGAIGPFLAGERFHRGPDSYLEGYRILGHDAHYDRILALGRAGILPFFVIACAVVFLWARRIAGPGAALAATLVFSTTPPILAHSGVLTTDMALATFTGAAALASIYWAEHASRNRSIVFGIAIALAALSKFSSLALLPAAWICMWLTWPRPIAWRAVPVVIGTAALVIWAAYGFSFARVDFLHARLPAPRFFSGIYSLWKHNRSGHTSYLLGQHSTAGFRYYYPIVLAVKTPLAMLLLMLAAIWRVPRAACVPLAFCAGVLAAAMMGRVDIGVRLILPIYVGMAVVCGVFADAAPKVAGVLLAWQVISGAIQHPDYLAYFNELAGAHPENIVADSDLDWGQDMKRLGDYLRSNKVTQVAFSPFNRTYLMAGHPLPALTQPDPEHPSPGWNAVSITMWKVFGDPAWPGRTTPQIRIGRSILLWYFPP